MPKLVSDERMFDAVNILLGMQNANGGFASYELIRGPGWLEKFNPAEVFGSFDSHSLFRSFPCSYFPSTGDIMIEHSYPECTTSVITALSIFRRHHPQHRPHEIKYYNLSLSILCV